MLVPLPDLPVLFEDIDWTPFIPQQKTRSEFTSRTKTIGMPGAERWLATAHVLAPASDAEVRAWRAFIISCRGSENTFYLPALPLRQTSATEPTVTAAVTGNRAVTVSSAANVAVGMYATVKQVDGHHRLVTVVGIDGLNVHFEPYLSADPDTGETFVIGEPYARMQLPNPDTPLPKIGRRFQFEAEEKL